MKKIYFLSLAAAFLFTACSDDKPVMPNTKTISFEINEQMRDIAGKALQLGEVEIVGAWAGGVFQNVFCAKGYMNREDTNGAYFDDILFTTADNSVGFGSYFSDMSNNVYGAYDTWGGFALSQNFSQASSPGGLVDYSGAQFSAWATSGANRSATFAIGYVNDYDVYNYNTPKILFATPTKIAYLYLANATVAAQYQSSLNDYWFEVIITGYLNGVQGQTIKQRLINGTNITNDWIKVDCTVLGKVDEVRFGIASNDMSGPYLNCPSYFCIDEIIYE